MIVLFSWTFIISETFRSYKCFTVCLQNERWSSFCFIRYCSGISAEVRLGNSRYIGAFSSACNDVFLFQNNPLSFCSGRTAQAAEWLGRWFRVWFSAEARYLSLLHGIQTGSGSRGTSYTMGTGTVSLEIKRQESKAVRSVHSTHVRAGVPLPPPPPRLHDLAFTAQGYIYI
jgi:hypothetical protein